MPSINPVWMARRAFRTDQELSCDSRALAGAAVFVLPAAVAANSENGTASTAVEDPIVIVRINPRYVVDGAALPFRAVQKIEFRLDKD